MGLKECVGGGGGGAYEIGSSGTAGRRLGRSVARTFPVLARRR